LSLSVSDSSKIVDERRRERGRKSESARNFINVTINIKERGMRTTNLAMVTMTV
jgi:hypothetical protein